MPRQHIALRRIAPAVALVLAVLAPHLLAPHALADDDLVGRTDRSAVFRATHAFEIDVPGGATRVQAWFAMPSRRDPAQEVLDWSIDCPYPTRIVRDQWFNEFLYLEVENPEVRGIRVVVEFTIRRWEVSTWLNPARTRPHTEEELRTLAPYLRGSSQSVIDDDVKAMAAAAVGDETNPVRVARLLYDAVLEHVDYHVKDPKPDAQKTMNSSGKGSSRVTYETCTGNCTDFHSLYAALIRSRGVPSRAVYGSFFKGPLDGADADQSYHCWIEFHAPGIGWVPLDVAVADVFTADFEANEHSRPRANLTVADGYEGPDADLVDYYFGNLEERRVVWHRNRDLVLQDPPQAGAPLLWLPKAYVEVDGKPHSGARRKLTFEEIHE